jgi:hypothetical protein
MIQGVNGELTALKIGTICWKIQDDQGRTHVLTLPNSYYAPSSPYRLLSPQHWAQTAKDYSPSPRGTWSVTDDWIPILCIPSLLAVPSTSLIPTKHPSIWGGNHKYKRSRCSERRTKRRVNNNYLTTNYLTTS